MKINIVIEIVSNLYFSTFSLTLNITSKFILKGYKWIMRCVQYLLTEPFTLTHVGTTY